MILSKRPMKNPVLHILAIIVLTAIAYSTSFSNSFHFDDRYAIIENEAIKNIENLPIIFADIFNRPLLRATFAVNFFFGGLDVFGYHLFNLLLHIIVGLEVYFLAGIIYKRFFNRSPGVYPLVTALVFSLHPLSTGSVTYIASRSAVMATAFYLGAFLLFLKADGRGGGGSKGKTLFYFLSAFVFILGLGVKEIVITLPLIIVLYVFFTRSGNFLSRIRTNPGVFVYFALLFIYLLGRYIAMPDIIPIDPRIEEGTLKPYPYFLTELKVIIFYYLRWLIFPFDMPHVDPDIAPESSILGFSVISAMVMIIGISFAAVRLRKNHALASFAILWYFITLLPTSSVIPLGDVAVERHVYLPSIGFFLIIGYLLEMMNQKLKRFVYPALFALLIYLTISTNAVWRTEATLWEDAAKKAPNKLRVLNNRAWGYYVAGDKDASMRYYEELIERYPDYPYGRNNLAVIYQEKGDMQSAIGEFKKAVSLRPGVGEFRINLSIAYDMAGLFKEAVGELEIAVSLNPKDFRALTSLASTLAKKGEFNHSIEAAKKALELSPNDPMPYYIIGFSRENLGLFNEALDAYERALELKPEWDLPKARMSGILKTQKR